VIGALAQLVEHFNGIEGVSGSSPLSSIDGEIVMLEQQSQAQTVSSRPGFWASSTLESTNLSKAVTSGFLRGEGIASKNQ
jgi:hypothetical protein